MRDIPFHVECGLTVTQDHHELYIYSTANTPLIHVPFNSNLQITTSSYYMSYATV